MPRPSENSKQLGVVGSKLYSRSKFEGFLNYNYTKYKVEILLLYVDEQKGYLCGDFTIKAAIKETTDVTTCFNGEIINKKCPFLTRSVWGTDEDVDEEHWSRFAGFSQFAETFNSDSFDYDKLKNSDYVFMRWMDNFVVPDHKSPDPTGASFLGFYYICFQKSTSSIEGYYYHPEKDSWYKRICLTHVPERIISIYEFT